MPSRWTLVCGAALVSAVLLACTRSQAPAPTPTVVPPPAAAEKPAVQPTTAPVATQPAPTVAPSPPAAEKPAPPAAAVQRVRVTGAGAEGVNMRAEPSTTAARVKVVRDGAQLEIAGEDRQADGRAWRNVKDPADGATGWIAAEFVAAADAPAPAVAAPPAAKPAAPAPTAAPKPAPKPATGRAAPQGSNCPDSHPVKGNQGSGGRIYHVRGGRSYNSTDPEECFATPGDAQAAGYRAAEN